MSRTGKPLLALGLAVALGFAPAARADVIDTVDFAPDSSLDGTGSGTLAGGAIGVTFTTSVGGPINAGETFGGRDWSTGLGTAAAAPGGTTFDTGGSLGEYANVSQTQTITFGKALVDPTLFINFDDPTVTYNFGAVPLTLLASNNAQLNGDVVTFVGSTNSVDDGFAVRLTGSYSILSFSATSTIDATQTFTIGIPLASVPEPSTYALLGVFGVAGSAVAWPRRRRGV